jgi:ABC-type transport system involved in cytochrome c biogenesis permease subunit
MSDLVLRTLHTSLLMLTVATVIAAAPGRTRSTRLPVYLAAAAALVGVAGLVTRTIVSGHLPIFGTIENTWTCATAIMGTAAVAGLFGRAARPYWTLLPPWAASFLAAGLFARFDAVPLTISEQSGWVDLHVGFAWAAFVALLWAGTIAATLLARRSEQASDHAEASAVVARLVLVGYTLLTAMILAGAWYLFVLFGVFWRWEIVGTSALIAWLGYSIAIHGWLMHGWRGARFFGIVAAMLVPLLVLFWVWSVFPGTYHFFDIPLLTPY